MLALRIKANGRAFAHIAAFHAEPTVLGCDLHVTTERVVDLLEVRGVDELHTKPSIGAQDISFMLQVKSGADARLRQGEEGSCFLHNTRCDFNDDGLPLGAALYAGFIEHGMPLHASP